MSLKSSCYPWLVITSLVLVVNWLCSSVIFAQDQVNDAVTEKLKILSETMDEIEIGQVDSVINAGADVNIENKYRLTPLYMASMEGHIEMVELLLAANANVDAAKKMVLHR